MMSRSIRLAAGFSLLLCCACITFKLAPPAPAEHLLEKITFCARVEEGPDALEPIGTKDAFNRDDGQVCCLIVVQLGPRTLTLRWKWYSPE